MALLGFLGNVSMANKLKTIDKITNLKPSVIKNTIGYSSLILSIFGLGIFGSATTMGIGVAGSALFLAFANLERFVRFKGAGFEAEMREIVDEANATIDNLRSVATPMISSYITNLTNEGMLIETDIDAKRIRYDNILKLQKELDIDHVTIDEAKKRYLLTECRGVLTELIRDLNPDSEDEAQPKHVYLKLLAKFRKEVSGTGYLETPNLDEARKFLVAEHPEATEISKIEITFNKCESILQEIDLITLAE